MFVVVASADITKTNALARVVEEVYFLWAHFAAPSGWYPLTISKCLFFDNLLV